MIKKYDFKKAKRIIENKKDSIIEASLGMREDWFWTANVVFENGAYIVELDNIEKVAGIDSSDWATPVIRIEYKGEVEEVFECFTGDNNGIDPSGGMATSGPLSRPVQKSMPQVKKYD
ncbi:hypothetical protein GCM10007063_05940 [Lentibacillus kapialis]|uniref:Uncharacterized protein n=1 Tax=Lentibacillus kapialis TaxID=340214 RepID=A0A917PNR5_9BACI|nr:hypothetical protein [Lentibacillus kapialis]GGJ86257.1 hypothetical protein GCM10007063_05940 [Lentibacillus kapialis]